MREGSCAVFGLQVHFHFFLCTSFLKYTVHHLVSACVTKNSPGISSSGWCGCPRTIHAGRHAPLTADCSLGCPSSVLCGTCLCHQILGPVQQAFLLLLLFPAVVLEVCDIVIFHIPFNCFEAGACVFVRDGVGHIVHDVQVVSDSLVDMAHRRPGAQTVGWAGHHELAER